MFKAGQDTDAVIDELTPLLDDGDVIVDCGNAHFADTRRRERVLAASRAVQEPSSALRT
jgi:6-phosphogluconate dehydrogenase